MKISDILTKEALDISRRPMPNINRPIKSLRIWKTGDKILDRYEVWKVFGGPGKSGMGIVYLCWDEGLQGFIAVKTLQDKYFRYRATIDLFKLEAETWISMNRHRNVVEAKYVINIEKRPHIFLESVIGDPKYGSDLFGWIRGGGLRKRGEPYTALILFFAIQFCHGMIHAINEFKKKGKDFVHCDIKPQNILITHDRIVKVTDFGLSKAIAVFPGDVTSEIYGIGANKCMSFAKSGQICGTPPYMSPEQYRDDKDIDTRADIYAFGCVLYEMLTRRYIFDVLSSDDFREKHLNDTPKPPKVHPELDRLIMSCLEKEKQNRPSGFPQLMIYLSMIYDNYKGQEADIRAEAPLNVLRQEGKVPYYEISEQQVELPDKKWLIVSKLINQGVSFNVLNKFAEAENCYIEALKIDPNIEVAHFGLGNSYFQLGKFDEAVRELKRGLKISANHEGAHCLLGNVYYEQGKFAKAVIEYKKELKIKSAFDNISHMHSHIQLGAIYARQGKLDMAVREFREVLKNGPNEDAYGNLIHVYISRGNWNMAVIECRKLLKINPDSVDAHNDLGFVYRKQGKLEKAVQEFKKGIFINPEDEVPHFNLGMTYRNQGKLDKAITEYHTVLKINPGRERVHFQLGMAYANQGNLKKALHEFRKEVQISPNYEGAHFNLGLVYEQMGMLNKAVKHYKEVLRINPDNPQAHKRLGNIFDATGCFNEAFNEYKEVIRLNLECTNPNGRV